MASGMVLHQCAVIRGNCRMCDADVGGFREESGEVFKTGDLRNISQRSVAYPGSVRNQILPEHGVAQ